MEGFKKNPREVGSLIEDKACYYLKQKGLKLLSRNFLCKQGEIDLIMQDKTDLVFVEVRYRHSDAYGDGVESIAPYKQKRIINAAHIYLNKYKISQEVGCRFDVLAVSSAIQHHKLKIDWIQDAFQIEY